MATKWPSFDKNTMAKLSFRFIMGNEQDFVFPESTTVNGEEICQARTQIWMLPRT